MTLLISYFVCFAAASYFAAAVDPSFYYESFLKGYEANSANNFPNYVFSPLSLVPTLGSLALGAEGNTRREILDVLGAFSMTQLTRDYQGIIQGLLFQHCPQHDISVKLFVQQHKTVNHVFSQVAKSLYGLEIEKVNFYDYKRDAIATINDWVHNQTHSNIPDILAPPILPDSTSAALLNTMNFEGKWEQPFESEGLQYFEYDSYKKVKYMGTNGYYNYYNSSLLHAELVTVPYKDSKCGLLIVNPHEDSTVDDVIIQLKDNVDVVNREVKKQKQFFANLSLPKFSYKSYTFIHKVLKDMGVEQIFTKNAKLHRILKDGSDLFVERAAQKNFLEIDEDGTHAATVGQITTSKHSARMYAMGMTYLHIKVKKPFYFEVRCDNVILYNGVITNPNRQVN